MVSSDRRRKNKLFQRVHHSHGRRSRVTLEALQIHHVTHVKLCTQLYSVDVTRPTAAAAPPRSFHGVCSSLKQLVGNCNLFRASKCIYDS